MDVLHVIWHGLRDSLLMAWQVWWALVLGFAISAIVQAWVPRERIEGLMSGSDVRAVGWATGLGAASSSCSYAATAIAKSLFQKGASAASALAFQFASTNLVWELGLVAWVLLGYAFSGFIHQITAWIATLGHAVLVLIGLLALAYAISILVFTIKARKYSKIRKITALDLKLRLEELEANRVVVIADVRSHNYYDPGMQRIKNSIRVEPTRLREELEALRAFMAPECEIYLYCSCIRDTTSNRIAHMLEQENCRTSVIEGGMKAWVRAGGELESVPAADIQHLPRFE